jgi:acetyltransferase-like isoleucine patch superfamily enzyme
MQISDRFSNWEYPDISDGIPTKYNWIVQNLSGLTLGVDTDIGAFSYINALNEVVIEDGVQIGSHCSLYSISTIDNSSGKITLKQKCRIGSHSTILPGVTVGKNSIIGAHSLVNNNIPDNVVAFGVPAKVVRELNSNE